MFKKITTIAVTAMLFNALPALADQKITEQVLSHHLESFGAGDVEAIMMDYTNESVVMLPSGALIGKEKITGLFQALVSEFSKPGMTFKLTNTKTEGNLAYITWKAETQDNIYNFATDTFIIKDGKIAQQTIAFDVVQKVN